MKQYSTFIFDSYHFDPATGEICLRYALDDELRFEEKISIGSGKQEAGSDVPQETLLALHLIGGISYYKTCLPETIEVRSGTLTEDQAAFWNTVYTKGLAEFCYRNEIDPNTLARFPQAASRKPPADNQKNASTTFNTAYLVPIGGGKDSMVTAELLKDGGIPFDFFRVGTHPIIEELAERAGTPLVTASRSLDPQLFDLNKEGALNGHVPISAYISFLSMFVAQLHGYRGVIMSNERSANFGNITHNNADVNHQWSKSLEFEDMMQDYIRTHLGTDVQYFSLLRGMSELAITQLFTTHPEYLPIATSCNRNWRLVQQAEDDTSKWCGQCPKCAFVFCQMAAFLPRNTVAEIFGKDLFSDESLLPLYRQLLNVEGMKPFECVGTPEEVRAAFLLALTQDGWEETPAMQLFLTEAAPDMSQAPDMVEDALELSNEHRVPPDFLLQLHIS